MANALVAARPTEIGPSSGRGPLVSVCILTYQHARFIGRALEGALAQKTDFDYEVLIGEDESTDGTREVCREWARRHPEKIRLFERSRKDVVLIDGRPRGSYNLRATIYEARGEFVALCEGDDFWTDPGKLQCQVEYLRANPHCVGCFHDVSLVDVDGQVLKSTYFQSEQTKFSQHDVLQNLMSKYPTCSLLFRRNAFDPLPSWFLRRPCDLYLDLHLTSKGSLDFINRNMGAYRKHAGGIWSGQKEAHQLVELIIRYKLLLAEEFFLANYRELLLGKIDEFLGLLFTRADFEAELLRLDKIVVEQTAALAAGVAQAAAAQKFIDGLNQQVAGLALTAKEQTGYIGLLETERDRLAATLEEVQAGTKRTQRESEAAVGVLRKQMEKFAATCTAQAEYISSLEAERSRLGVDLADVQRAMTQIQKEAHAQVADIRMREEKWVATCREQTNYIAILESEKNRLMSNSPEIPARAEGAPSEGAVQAASSLQVENLMAEAKHYVAVIKEQLAYIQSLEAERDRIKARAK